MLIKRKTGIRGRDNRSDVQNKDTEATIYLYGDIGGWFGIDSAEWVKEFNALKAGTIHVRVDSGGGDIFSARAMKTAIMQSKATVIAHVDGLAASAASFFIMGADEIEIVDGGFLMIHKAMSFIDVYGYFNDRELDATIADLTKEVGLHGKLNEAIANDYAKRTGLEVDELLDMMSDETWLSAADALEKGFVDRVFDGEPVEGKYDLAGYEHVPDVVAKRNKVTKRSLERALRDAGLTNKEAKRVISEGLAGDGLRDDDIPGHGDDGGDAVNSLADGEPPDIRDDADADEPGKLRDDVPEGRDAKDPVRNLLIRAMTITQ